MTSAAGFRKDLFDCAGEPGGLPRCLYVCCCLPCSIGSLVSELDDSSGVCCAGSTVGGCCLYTLLGTDYVLGSCYHCVIRKGVRKQTGLVPDEGMSECLTVCLCGPCATCQELNHLELCKNDPPKINPVGMQVPQMQQMQMQQYPPQQMQQPVININVGPPQQQQYPQPGYNPGGYPPQPGYPPQQQPYGAPPPPGYPTY